MLKYEVLWPGGPLFIQSEDVFKIGYDSLLLAEFADLRKVKTLCDLGCGSGILPALLHGKKPGLSIDAIEISQAACELAEQNFRLSGMSAGLVCGDLRAYKEYFKSGYYDLVITNPPYFPKSGESASRNSTLAAAREETKCTLGDVLDAARYLLKNSGRFVLVYRPERLSELFCEMSIRKIEPKRLKLVQKDAASSPSLVLVEGRAGGGRGLTIEPPVIYR